MEQLNMRVMELFDLKGKIAAITGGGGDLCGTMADALGEIGVKVAILDADLENAKKREKAIIDAGGEAKAFCCNVLEEEQLKKSLEEIRDLWGVPELLINGAGGNNPLGSTTKEFLETEDLNRDGVIGFLDLDFAGVSKVFNLNFLGTFLSTKIFSRGMIENQKGVVVNIASMSGFTPLTKVMAYSAAKAAVANFTRWLAVHFSHIGIRVNAIAPGFFMTEQLRFLHIDQKTGEYTPRARKVIAHTPMGRYGDPEDLIGVLIWLLSGASKFVTGVVVPVDGGVSSYSI